MDPTIDHPPSETGTFEVEDGVVLYYEIRGMKGKDAPVKLVCHNGAQACMKHFDGIAGTVVERLHKEKQLDASVVSFDPRGIGKSTVKYPSHPNTTDLLAQDALKLINHIWGEDSKSIHLFGPSLGGMVSSKLALLLGKRCKSLYIAVSTGRLGTFFKLISMSGILPYVIPFAKPSSLSMILNHSFHPEFLDEKVKNGDKTIREAYTEIWTREYDLWFAFNQPAACSAQVHAAMSHELTAPEATKLKESKLPITQWIGEKDSVIPPSRQRELARLIESKVLSVPSAGHTNGNRAEMNLFFDSFIDHLSSAQALP